MTVIDPALLKQIAGRAFDPHFSIENAPGRYRETMLPLEGSVSVAITKNKIAADLLNLDGWESRSFQALPRGSIIDPRELFRPSTPGLLIGNQHRGSLFPNAGGWEALGCIFSGANHHYAQGEPPRDTYRFEVERLIVDGPDPASSIAIVRQIYSRAAWYGTAIFRGNRILIGARTDEQSDLDAELLSATIDAKPSELEAEALWHVLSFVSGNTVRALAEEFYDDAGKLIRTVWRLGANVNDRRRGSAREKLNLCALES